MGNENSTDVWYIPQNVPFDIIKSILGHCYNSQKRNQTITSETIKKTITKSEKTVGYALKMLENMGILALNTENNSYSLSEVSMKLAEKLLIKEDVTTEINEIIDNSFLHEMLQIIVTNETITKEQLIGKILINSAAGMVKDNRPYVVTINCLLDILNLSEKIPKEKYLELRGNPEETERTPSTKTPRPRTQVTKKKEKPVSGSIDTTLPSGILGIVKTERMEVKIMNVEDIQFGRTILDKLEKDLSASKSENNTAKSNQITPKSVSSSD